MSPFTDQDQHWMRHAITLAQHGQGLTAPNPPVGAVIIKNGKLLGEGWHQGAGKPHAEREAIANALAKHPANFLQGATIYVTLEPCSTHGRTPPCTEGIIDAGITRVIWGATDPNPAHQGAAKKLLNASRIETAHGLEEKACKHLIRAFTKTQTQQLPWVIIKSAMSLDGKITRPPGEGQWLTSPESRQIVQQIRHECDAIITGGNTLRIDNPSLTQRDTALPNKTQPWRMVITRNPDNLPPNSNLFTDDHANRTLIHSNENLTDALKTLYHRGCLTVLVEAGGKLLESFINSGHVDEVALFYAPLITGGQDHAIGQPEKPLHLTQPQYRQVGNDIYLRALVAHMKHPL